MGLSSLALLFVFFKFVEMNSNDCTAVTAVNDCTAVTAVKIAHCAEQLPGVTCSLPYRGISHMIVVQRFVIIFAFLRLQSFS